MTATKSQEAQTQPIIGYIETAFIRHTVEPIHGGGTLTVGQQVDAIIRDNAKMGDHLQSVTVRFNEEEPQRRRPAGRVA